MEDNLMVYEVWYRHNDDLDRIDPLYGLIVAYNSCEIAGETFAHALDCGDEDGDYSGVNELLKKAGYDLTDEDIMFYFDRCETEDEPLVDAFERDSGLDITVINIRDYSVDKG